MSVEECIDEYRKLSPKIFVKKHHRVDGHGHMRGRYDSAAFEQGIKEMLEKLGLHQDTLLEEDVSDVPQRDCKVQVQELTYTDIANTDQDL